MYRVVWGLMGQYCRIDLQLGHELYHQVRDNAGAESVSLKALSLQVERSRAGVQSGDLVHRLDTTVQEATCTDVDLVMQPLHRFRVVQLVSHLKQSCGGVITVARDNSRASF